MKQLIRLFAIAGAIGTLPAGAEDAALSITKQADDKVQVRVGDKPFTELLFGNDRSKPVFYPIYGPGQVRMTRDFPFSKDTKGEKHDHPHHESLWYTHGDVNGISFWHIGKDTGTIKQNELSIAGNTIRTSNDWIGPDKRRVCSDVRTVAFSTLPGGARVIDFKITIKASDGDVKFGDTKEGSMGIRTHHLLRTDKGADVRNSAGQTGQSIWGKAAKWVNYQSEIDGKPIGVAVFDHPTNPRHPTTWHARQYGLVAANPFGARHFSGAAPGTGDLLIKGGESATFRYAFVFHRGSDEEKSVEELHAAWANQ